MDLSTREGRRAQGKLIQAAAKESGYSAEQLAQIAGCSRALIYQYYSGATLAQTDRLQRIAQAVEKPMAYFFGETGVIVPDENGTPLPAIVPASETDGDVGYLAPPPAASQEDIPPPNVDAALSDLTDLARAQSRGPDPDGLLRTTERIVALARLAGRMREEADASFRAGNVRTQRREGDLAVDPLRRARELYQRLGDEPMTLQVTQSLGAALASLGRFEDAKHEFERVASSANWEARWRGQIGLASLFEQSGELDLALEALAHVLATQEDAPDPKEGAQAACYARANQVNIFLALGDLQSALMAAMECEREADVLALPDQRVESLYNAGLALAGLGRVAQAMERLDLSRQLAAFAGQEARALMCQAAQGWCTALIGRLADGAAVAQGALRAAVRGTDDRAKGVCELELAKVLERSGRLDEGRYHAEEAQRVLADLRLTVPALGAEALGARLSAAGGDGARELLDVRERAEHVGAKGVEMEARIGLALHGPQAGRAEEAQRALDLGREMRDVDGTIRAAGSLARITDDPDTEVELLEEALAAMEVLRSNAPSEQEAVLEDPDRLLLCRRYLYHLQGGSGPDVQEWLDGMSWPPIEEEGPLEEWSG
ncbi:MAG: helix-turn-helix domain-containing protein [Armatimonadia bacterium]|nr:helix-turn-helix domain-containing protein [Armatimonadia bacterium]